LHYYEAIADNLVSAAHDEADESMPAVHIRDAPAVYIDGSADIPQIPRRTYFARFDSGRSARDMCVLLDPNLEN
jgi:hypothetical protein